MAPDPERIKRVGQALASAGLSGLITAEPSTVLLLSGYWPVVGNSIALASAHGQVTVIAPEDEADLAQSTTSHNLIQYSPGLLDSIVTTADQLRHPLSAALDRLELKEAVLGIEQAHTIQPATYAASARFRTELTSLLHDLAPRASLRPSDQLVALLQASKTPVELEQMRTACKVAKNAFEQAHASIRPGASEDQIASAFQSAFDTSPTGTHVQRSYGFFFCMSGPNAASASAAYARTRRRIVEAGDLVMIHANTCADGYWTDITRTYTAGPAPERHNQMRSAIAEARAAALGVIRPGARSSDVDRAARNVMHRHGFDDSVFRHGTGHGVGFAAISGDALPRIHPSSPDILTEGMTFNIEPAAYFDGYGGMRHCDVVAVTASGAEVLTDF